MAIVVEDGSGFADSETYISVEEATAYHAERGHADWIAATIEEQEAALRRATEWLDATYRGKFIGYRTKARAQALEWPRSGASYVDPVNGPSPYGWLNNTGLWTTIASNAIPIELKRAEAEAALRELVQPGILYPDIVPGKIVKSVAISGSVSVTFADGTPLGQRTIITAIAAILGPLLDSTVAPGGPMFGTSERVN